jgi:two-component system, cell cycle sensor histidine kinase and response regulator CckA
MTTALLKFQRAEDMPPQQEPLASSVFMAALDNLPEPLAICENSALLYANRRFADIFGPVTSIPENGASSRQWQTVDFQADHRRLSLCLPRHETAIPVSPHLALVGRMVGGVAHDFNNLLTGILLYCDLLQTKFAPSNPLGKKIDEIRLAAEHGARLIRQLMNVGREETNAPRKAHINPAITELRPLLRHLVGENIQVAMTLDNAVGAVGISVAQAEQIVLNLVLNARDAMPSGGQITVETRLRDCEGVAADRRIVEIGVSDRGQGMDAKTASRIFEPFFTTKASGRGSGMGLATVRKIVDDAGGMVCVETELGKGTRMIVRLPQVELDPAPFSANRSQDSISDPKR